MSQPQVSTLVVTLPVPDSQVFIEAARLLIPILGVKAPTPVELVLHELSRRKPKAVVEEYLYFIGWFEPKRTKRAQGRKNTVGQRGDAFRAVEPARGILRRHSLTPRATARCLRRAPSRPAPPDQPGQDEGR
jgi:hypothetical protein